MSRTITVRNVRDEVADELAARAARSGRSLQAFMIELMEQTAAKRPLAEIFAEIEARAKTDRTELGADEIVRAIREDRDDPRR